MENDKKMVLNGVTYVQEGSIKEQSITDYCIIRTYSAGVFAGTVDSRDGKEAVLKDSRMLWKWSGALALSDVAKDGVDPSKCKFTAEVPKRIVTEVIEIIYCTREAAKIIKGVTAWVKR